MIWLSAIACAAAMIIACSALIVARRAFHHVTVVEALLTSSSQRVIEAESELDALRGQLSALASRVDQLGLRQSRIESVAGKPGFNEAIAFARHGANERELVDTCGLSRGEARLVQVLYGKDVEGGPDSSSHESPSNEAH